MSEPITMIDPEYLKAILAEVKDKIDYFNSKKKLSVKDRLFREHMITVNDNPTPANVILLLAGRLDELKRR